MRASKDVACDDGLFREIVPKLEWKIFVGSAKATDEVVFESLYSSLCGVDSMVVGFHELHFSVLLLHEILDGLGCLVVGDIECWLVAPGGEGLEHLLESFHNVTVRSGVDREGKDIVGVVRVRDKK